MVKLGLGEHIALYVCFAIFCLSVLSFSYALGVVAVVLSAVYFHYDRKQRVFERIGIPGPKQPYIFGDWGAQLKLGGQERDVQYVNKYGKYCGVYLFLQPHLITTDLELIKRVTVKDFNNFIDHMKSETSAKEQSELAPDDLRLAPRMLTALQGQHWKNVRNTITPTFTAGKIKQMVLLMHGCMQVLDELLSEKAEAGNELDLKPLFANYTMDIIGKTAFALDIGSQRKPDNPFMNLMNSVIDFRQDGLLTYLIVLFPYFFAQLGKWLPQVNTFDNFFRDSLMAVINERRKETNSNRPDFMQLLLNTQRSPNEQEMTQDSDIVHKELQGGKKVQLSDIEVVAQCLFFLFAGHETTASTLYYMTFLLALHPEAQERLYEEIIRVVKDDEEITCEHVQKMTFLEAVMFETLRLYPVAIRIDRTAEKEFTYNGYTFPAYTVVDIPIYAIHHSEEFYPNPEEFQPERFLPEERANRNAYSFLPWGLGPRNCIGMRFAQTEIKLTIAHILRRFKFLRTANTPSLPLKFAVTLLLKPKTPLILKVEKRAT